MNQNISNDYMRIKVLTVLSRYIETSRQWSESAPLARGVLKVLDTFGAQENSIH